MSARRRMSARTPVECADTQGVSTRQVCRHGDECRHARRATVPTRRVCWHGKCVGTVTVPTRRVCRWRTRSRTSSLSRSSSARSRRRPCRLAGSPQCWPGSRRPSPVSQNNSASRSSSRPTTGRSGWTDRAGLETSFSLSYAVLEENFDTSKNTGTSFWHFVTDSTKLRGGMSTFDQVVQNKLCAV